MEARGRARRSRVLHLRALSELCLAVVLHNVMPSLPQHSDTLQALSEHTLYTLQVAE